MVVAFVFIERVAQAVAQRPLRVQGMFELPADVAVRGVVVVARLADEAAREIGRAHV